MEVFIEAFQPVLKVPRGDVEMLFMKIDVNSDGVVTWNEFSSFILDMSEKVRFGNFAWGGGGGGGARAKRFKLRCCGWPTK